MPPIYVAIFARRDIAAVLAAARAAIASSNATGGGFAGLVAAVGSAVAHSGADPRLLLATLLATAWGCRLTFNFWRRGGYNPRFEDYRLRLSKQTHVIL
jgi:steroid 5-alpha reductase family enzyme